MRPRFVVELLVEHVDPEVDEGTIAQHIALVLRRESNPLVCRVVSFMFRGEKTEGEEAAG